MGSPGSETDHRESPQHRVTIARQFAVGKFSVTFDEWDACVADHGCDQYMPSDNHWGRGRRPVINVSWHDAQNYVAWLSQKTGKTYRLLTEAEREYVTRAGATTPFWWGSSISTQQANYFTHRTLPVDSFQPNPWSLYQVHGNVSDWTKDCWHENYFGAPSDGSAWVSGDCKYRVIRGGSWNSLLGELRSAYRSGDTSDRRESIVTGFRVARTLTP
jgi:formylglycine-generating enzyme required for sulfatase activity